VHSAAVRSTPRPHPAAVTRWRTTPRVYTPRLVVAVQRGDMHVPGGQREQRRQRTQRDARNRGAAAAAAAAAAVVVSRCSRSLAASVACRPLHVVDDVRLGEEGHVIHRGKCPGMQKSRGNVREGENVRGKSVRGDVRLPHWVTIN